MIRLHKAEGADAIRNTVDLRMSEHAYGEVSAGGPAEKALLKRLKVVKHSVVPDSPEWTHFAKLRTGFSTVDLGEDQAIAIALAEADRGKHFPLVGCDDGAAAKAARYGVPAISFLQTLAWLLTCGLLTEAEVESLQLRATARDGWKRPSSYASPLQEADAVAILGEILDKAVDSWKAASPRPKARRR